MQAKNINYIDLEGYLFFQPGSLKICLERTGNIKVNKKQKLKPSQSAISPTLLISPNGLAILEALITQADSDFKLIHSSLQFCKQFDLFQPKLSKIMTGLGVKTLWELKKKLKAFPIEWWIYTLDSSLTKRKMTPFFEIAQDYYSLDSRLAKFSNVQILNELYCKYKNKVSDGPTQIAIEKGNLIDNNLTLWVDPTINAQVKKEYKLVAGTKHEYKTWKLASPSKPLEKTDIISHLSPTEKGVLKTNIFRSIWDLGFSEERLREIRLIQLKELLK